MRICVAHETVYRYDAPCSGVIQTLRLTPRNHAGQYIVNWRIDVSADHRLEPVEDAFGNILHAISIAGPLSELRLAVDGEVEIHDTAGVVRSAVERFPPSLFLRETALTRPDGAIRTYAAHFSRPSTAGMLSTLHSLLARIHQDFAVDAGAASGNDSAAGSTTSWGTPPAADAFRAGRGQPRDLAHIFIAVARTLGVPARFVAGYISRNGASGVAAAGKTGGAAGDLPDHAAPDNALPGPADHALSGDRLSGDVLSGDFWAEVHIPDLGWVGFDPANGVCATDQYVRVAIGLDYLGAAPVRGAHYGGVREDVAVKLRVSQALRQRQE
jgi:transglutaminase-like putative cysteine protease